MISKTFVVTDMVQESEKKQVLEQIMDFLGCTVKVLFHGASLEIFLTLTGIEDDILVFKYESLEIEKRVSINDVKELSIAKFIVFEDEEE